MKKAKALMSIAVALSTLNPVVQACTTNASDNIDGCNNQSSGGPMKDPHGPWTTTVTSTYDPVIILGTPQTTPGWGGGPTTSQGSSGGNPGSSPDNTPVLTAAQIAAMVSAWMAKPAIQSLLVSAYKKYIGNGPLTDLGDPKLRTYNMTASMTVNQIVSDIITQLSAAGADPASFPSSSEYGKAIEKELVDNWQKYANATESVSALPIPTTPRLPEAPTQTPVTATVPTTLDPVSQAPTTVTVTASAPDPIANASTPPTVTLSDGGLVTETDGSGFDYNTSMISPNGFETLGVVAADRSGMSIGSWFDGTAYNAKMKEIIAEMVVTMRQNGSREVSQIKDVERAVDRMWDLPQPLTQQQTQQLNDLNAEYKSLTTKTVLLDKMESENFASQAGINLKTEEGKLAFNQLVTKAVETRRMQTATKIKSTGWAYELGSAFALVDTLFNAIMDSKEFDSLQKNNAPGLNRPLSSIEIAACQLAGKSASDCADYYNPNKTGA